MRAGSILANMTERCNSSDEATWHFCLAEQQKETTLLMVPTLVYLCMLSVTGIVGNSLVLVVYPMRFTRSPIRTFIMAAAGFDLLTNTIVIPAEMYDIFHSWDFKQSVLCKARLYFNATTTMASALLLLAIAVTRYRKICRPFGWQVTMHHTKVINTAVLFLALLFSVPYAITNGIQKRQTKYLDIYGYSCLVDGDFFGTIWPKVNAVFFVVLFLFACVPLVALYVLIGTTARRHTTAGRVGHTEIQPGNSKYYTVSNIATTKTTDEVSTSGASLFTEHDKTAESSRDASSEDVRAQEHGNGKHERISLRKRILLKFQGKQNPRETTGKGVLNSTAYDYNDLAVCCRHSIERDSVTSFSGYYQDASNSAVQGVPKNGTELFIHGSHTLSLIKNKIIDELSRSNECDSQIRPLCVTGMSSKWRCDKIGGEIDGDTHFESDANTESFRTPVVIFLKEPTRQATTRDARQKGAFCTAARETRLIPDAVHFSAKPMTVQSIHTAYPDPAHIPGTSSGDKIKALVPNVVSNMVSNVVSNSPLPSECNTSRRQLQRSRQPKRIGRTSCMLLTMSVVFVGAFLPFLALEFFRSSADPEVFRNMDKVPLALYHLFLRSYLVNSAVNPIIYNLCHVKFRKECVKLLTRA